MKSLSDRFSVDATSPPTFTCAPLPNRMPFGFIKKTFPLAVRLPRIVDGSAPKTRLSATALLLGCTNRTVSPGPMLKLCQLITVLAVVWVTKVVPAPVLMLAPPAVTAPPVGDAYTCMPKPKANAMLRPFKHT